MHALSAFLVGLLFGIGLILAGMANPAKVQGFLDLAGAWDPSLALVMAGAIAVAMSGFHYARRMPPSLLEELRQLPGQVRIDKRLILGSLAFGAGWGVGGFCPGPALVVLGTGELKAVIFVLSMLAGMAMHWLIERQRTH
jgi:uncharacterized membrane protein YedE/YeeE